MSAIQAGTQQAAQYLRVKDVAAACAVSVTTIWCRVRTGTFPKPFKLGPRTTVWDAVDVRAWQEAQKSRHDMLAKGKGGNRG